MVVLPDLSSSPRMIHVKLTSLSLARRHLLNKMYNVMWQGALCGCPAIKFDFCNNLLSSVHKPVNILWYVY